MIVDLNVSSPVEKQALALAFEARDYLSRSVGGKDLREIQLRFLVCERIQWVVAWVLYQKAVSAGEITLPDVRRHLDGMIKRPAADDLATHDDIDPKLRALVEKSRSLFSRVQRLVRQAPASAGNRKGRRPALGPDATPGLAIVRHH